MTLIEGASICLANYAFVSFSLAGGIFIIYDYNNNFKYTKNIAYNTLWVYNYGKIQFEEHLKPKLNCFDSNVNYDFTLNIVKNGKYIDTYFFHEKDSNKVIERLKKSTTEYDFILLNNNKENISVRFDNIPDSFVYNKSNVKFLACEIVINDKTYEINCDNYYITGNKLFDMTFINMYMNNNYNLLVNESNYKVKLINEDFTVIELDDTKHLILNENDYTIICKTEDATTSPIHNNDENSGSWFW